MFKFFCNENLIFLNLQNKFQWDSFDSCRPFAGLDVLEHLLENGFGERDSQQGDVTKEMEVRKIVLKIKMLLKLRMAEP